MASSEGTLTGSRSQPGVEARSGRRWGAATAIGSASLGLLTLLVGPPLMRFPWDTLIILNGAYRVTDGHGPNDDAMNPIGPLVYETTSLGMRVQAEPSVRAVSFGAVLVLAMLTPIAWRVARNRCSPAVSAVCTLFTAVLIVSVRPLGTEPWKTSYAELYNRWAWVMLALVFLATLVPADNDVPARRRSPLLSGLVLGTLLSLLFYTKFTFVVFGVAAVALGLILGTVGRRPVRLAAGIALAFAVITVLQVVVFDVSVSGYLSDLTAAARAQSEGMRLAQTEHSGEQLAPVTLAIGVSLAALTMLARPGAARWKLLWRPATTIVFVLISSVLITAGDWSERFELPTLAVIALLLVKQMPGRDQATPGSVQHGFRAWRRLALVGTAAVVLGTVGATASLDLAGIGFGIAGQSEVRNPPASQVIRAPAYRDFVVPAESHNIVAYTTENELPQLLNDGMDLLRRHVRSGDHIVALAVTNPFSLGLALPATPGEPVWWDLGYNFDATHHPSAEVVLGHADWVIVPRATSGTGCCEQTVQTLVKVYGDYLHAHFVADESSTQWALLRRVG